MLRRLGRHVPVLICVPLFILLLISYRNHGNVTSKHEKIADAEKGMFTEELVIQRPLVEQVPVQVQVAHLLDPPKIPLQWNVLTDGTVTHRGTKDLQRKYSLLINNAHRCASLQANQSSFVVVVESDIVNFDERQLIRETWGLRLMQTIANYRVIFLVGLTHNSEIQGKLEFENHMYEDIVQIGTFEGFQNLTYKSIHMLHWFTQHCTAAKYLFKTDDDIFLHIPNLIRLFATTPFDGSLLCHHNKSRKILRSFNDIHYYVYTLKDRTKGEVLQQIRNKFNKYLIGFDKLPGSLYPDYCSGFGYAMNHEVARKLLAASTAIPYIGIEDVFVTGLCREKSNLTITNSVHFRLKPYITPIESVCAFEHGRITSNEMVAGELRKLWAHVNTAGYYCKMTPGK